MIEDGLTKAQEVIDEAGGSAKGGLPGSPWWSSTKVCDQCELEVITHWPLGTEYFDYDTKTKSAGANHVWGEISYEGKPVSTVDFWADDEQPWRPGENGFGGDFGGDTAL